MIPLTTRLHCRLARSQQAFGAFLGMNSPLAAEFIAAGCDLDWLALDLQHSATNVGDAAHLLRAIQAANVSITPLVRLPSHDPYWIQQSLDAGFMGLIVPRVETAEQARDLVEYTYLPPQGLRSFAGSIRAALYEDYFERVNETVFLFAQIESPLGAQNLEAIVSQPGVSGLFVGPADLSMSCGWKLEEFWKHEASLKVCSRVVEACARANKHAAILVPFPAAAAARNAGFQVIGFANDSYLIRVDMVRDINEQLAQLRPASE